LRTHVPIELYFLFHNHGEFYSNMDANGAEPGGGGIEGKALASFSGRAGVAASSSSRAAWASTADEDGATYESAKSKGLVEMTAGGGSAEA
jgi:hypothetical protein